MFIFLKHTYEKHDRQFTIRLPF